MCDELACRISDCSERTRKLVAQDNPENYGYSYRNYDNEQNTSDRRERARNLLQNYEQKIANLPYHLLLTNLCSNVGTTKTVARWQYFTTLDDAELEQLGGWCRENTLPRSDPLSKVKGWIRGNTKIGSTLDVAVTHHQGRYGFEIMTLLGDGTCSWVMIVNGINKYVMEMTEQTQDDHLGYIGERTGKLVAKARPKQTSTPTTSSKTALPYDQREWIDVEPGPVDKSYFEVSKKMIRLLRHDSSALREEDGAVEFRILAQMFRSEFTSSQHWAIRAWLNYLPKGGGLRKRFQYCVDPFHADTILYIRAIQSNSGGKHINPTLQHNVQAYLSRWKLPRHALDHPICIDSGWQRRQKRVTCGVLYGRESNGHRSLSR